MNGTRTLKTERLTLRKHVLEDTEILHDIFGLNSNMYEYSGWNPYKTPEMAENNVKGFIDDYSKEHFYAWVIEKNGKLIGTIGAYDYDSGDDSIEIGFSIAEEFWGQGFAGESLKCVLDYLMVNEGISIIKAWCAGENIASKKVLEKAGMKEIGIKTNAIQVGNKSYDQIDFEINKNELH